MGAMITSAAVAGVMAGMNWVMMATTMVSRISTVNAVGMRNCFFCFFTRIAPFDHSGGPFPRRAKKAVDSGRKILQNEFIELIP